jgi:hypothetical protein
MAGRLVERRVDDGVLDDDLAHTGTFMDCGAKVHLKPIGSLLRGSLNSAGFSAHTPSPSARAAWMLVQPGQHVEAMDLLLVIE